MSAPQAGGTRPWGVSPEQLALVLLAIVAGFSSVMYLYPGTSLPTSDSASYLFVADGMLKGRIPYTQLWENKGLPLYAIDMLGRVITPGRYTGLWFLQFVSVVLAFWGLFWTVRRFATVRATAFAGVLLVVAIVLTGAGGNTPEFWIMPLQATALASSWLLVSGDWASKRWLFVLTGFSAGVAMMMKVNLVGTWVALFGLLMALTISRHVAVLDMLKLLGMMAAGFFVAVLASVAPIVAWGATQAWWDQWVLFGVNMATRGVGATRAPQLPAIWNGIRGLLFIIGTVVAGGLMALAERFIGKKSPADSQRIWMGGFLLVWLGLTAWASTVNGASYAYYFMPWLIPSVALVGLLFGQQTMRWPGFALAGVIVALGLWYPLPESVSTLDLQRRFPPLVRYEEPERRSAQKRMIREIQSRTRPSDTVLMWGMEPVVFAETGRLSAGPYAHPLDILLAPGYGTEARFAAFMRDLEANPPKLIIDASYARRNYRLGLQYLRVPSPKDQTRGHIPVDLSPLADFVDSRYRRVASDKVKFVAPGRPTTNARVEYYELIGE